MKGHRNSKLGSLTQLAQSTPNRLSCLAGRFYGPQSRISNKIFSESLMHTLSPHKGPIGSFFNFTQSLLGVIFFKKYIELILKILGQTVKYY